jgi:hypothetical protein
MTSISHLGGEGPNLPYSKALGQQIEVAERNLEEQRRRVKKLRRERRLAKREEAAVWWRTRIRRGLFWIGNAAFAAAVMCFGSGLFAVGSQLAQFAFATWVAALQFPLKL